MNKLIINLLLVFVVISTANCQISYNSSLKTTPASALNKDVGIGILNPERQLHLSLSNCVSANEGAFLERFDNPFRITRIGGGTVDFNPLTGQIGSGMINCKIINWDLNVDIDNLVETININGTDQNGNPINQNLFHFGITQNVSPLALLVNGNFDVSGVTTLNQLNCTDINSNNINNSGLIKTNGLEVKGIFRIKNGSNINVFAVYQDGKVRSREVKVDLQTIPDYVFSSNYNLLSLQKLEEFITKEKHLPNIKSANDYEKEGGIELGELNMKLLEKVEELTLYVIQLKKELDQLKLK